MPRIVLLGDFAPIGRAASALFEVDKEDTDSTLMNLETPFPTNLEARPKAGPNLAGNFEVLARFIPRDFVLSLANNHIMDYGETGLRETINVCRNAGFEIVGAGINLNASSRPIIQNIEGVKIGILARTETQFGIATEWKAGVTPICPKIYLQIHELRERVDIVIVSVHGAAEMCPWPSPQWQDLLRSFIDAGASIVHGHHSHVPQGYEEYKNGLIFYGLGNFLVDPKIWKGQQNTLWSITPEIEIANEKLKCQINTSVISEDDDNSIVVRKSSSEEFENHRKYLEICNKPLNDKKLLTALWQEVSVRMYYKYYSKYLNYPEGRSEWEKLSIKGRIKSCLSGVIGGIRGKRHFVTKSTQNELLLWYHLFACESHRDSIATALGVLSCELEDMRTDETRVLADKMMPWSRNWQRDKV